MNGVKEYTCPQNEIVSISCTASNLIEKIITKSIS